MVITRLALLPLALFSGVVIAAFFSKKLGKRLLAAGAYTLVTGAVTLAFCLSFCPPAGTFRAERELQSEQLFYRL